MALRALGDAQGLQQNLRSSCATSKPESHEIFLSHAGAQKSFVSDLYNDFVRGFPSVSPFFDKESLPLGEEFPRRIFEAAQKCDVAIIILTKEYVTSKWPMLELLAFVKAQKSNPRLKLLPVFFDGIQTCKIDDRIIIDESWVASWESMSSEAHREITITVELCKEALRKLRKINGLVLINEIMSYESLRHGIVKAARAFLPSSSVLDTENIQGCLRLCETITDMIVKNQRGVYCLGLYGMGGLGKTTMCKALCSYFGLSSVRKVCHLEIESDDADVKELRFKRHIKILRSFSDVPKDQIDDIEKSHTDFKVEKYVQQCLSDKQLKFLAVDNVHGPLGSCEEAKGYLNFLSEGSIIVITSRSRENVLSVTRSRDFCKHFPVLEKDEAMTLFLKIAAPDLNCRSLPPRQREVLSECLKSSFFQPDIEANHEQAGIKDRGHYHPLALRAVASYLIDQNSGEENPFLCWERVLENKELLSYARHSTGVIEVLGLGFNDRSMCKLSKQLFIDVALYAPVGEDIFDWLVSINQCKPQTVKEKLKNLRRKCFLNYDDCIPSQESCQNISMHELYRDFAKAYLVKKSERVLRFGVYDSGDQHPLSLEDPGWAMVPRIHLQRLVNSDLAKVNKWRNVAVVHLVGCGEITTFSIGELVSLCEVVIINCSKLEVLSWTQDFGTKGAWGRKLLIVKLSHNKSLRTLPNFSDCSELRNICVKECSSSVEPVQFHNCAHLHVLCLWANDVPEVQSLKSCPELGSVRLRWKAVHKGLPLLEDLPRLRHMEIEGASDLPLSDMIGYSTLLGKYQFFKQYPKDIVRHDLTKIRVLTRLESVSLSCIPLGNLPMELGAVGSTLRNLKLSGCLLSQVVDFSAFPNLRNLNMSWTNVEEVKGLERLTELICLDCSYCFQLQKVPDLRPLSNLENLFFIQCPNLRGIPRLPLGCVHSCYRSAAEPEDMWRAITAALAFAKAAREPLPPRLFAVGERSKVDSSLSVGVACCGCMMFPILGPRYVASPVKTWYNLCSNCFSQTCLNNRCSDTEKTKPRWEAKGYWEPEYDLCSACYEISGRRSMVFERIDELHLPEQGPKPTATGSGQWIAIRISGSGVSASHSDHTSGRNHRGSLYVTVKSTPIRMPRQIKIGFDGS